MISSFFIPLFTAAGIVLLITAALSPLETLSWWAGWSEEEIKAQSPPSAEAANSDAKPTRHYVVYLSGISSISGRFLVPREKTFIQGLRDAFPDFVIIDDVFPYSPAGVGLLAGTRQFDRLWKRIQKLKLRGRDSILSTLIKFRNLFQVMVSADHRYGPIYNRGAATAIEKALLRSGYQPGSGAAVIIVGYSGGAQVGVGSATYLKARLQAPIDVISVGGVMASEPGLNFVRQLHHIVGNKDRIEKLGAILFPERWKAMAHSEWNIANREGRIIRHKMTDMAHAGMRGYFGLPKINGVSNNQRTLEKIIGLLKNADAT